MRPRLELLKILKTPFLNTSKDHFLQLNPGEADRKKIKSTKSTSLTVHRTGTLYGTRKRFPFSCRDYSGRWSVTVVALFYV